MRAVFGIFLLLVMIVSASATVVLMLYLIGVIGGKSAA
jgi:hypothetical protein